jgi:hypothetical protein
LSALIIYEIDPKEVIPKLVQMTLHKDVRVRSAADKALVTLLRQHKNIPQTVLTLLNSLRSPITIKPFKSINTLINQKALTPIFYHCRQLISDASQVQCDQQQLNMMIERTMKLLPLWAAEVRLDVKKNQENVKHQNYEMTKNAKYKTKTLKC